MCCLPKKVFPETAIITFHVKIRVSFGLVDMNLLDMHDKIYKATNLMRSTIMENRASFQRTGDRVET